MGKNRIPRNHGSVRRFSPFLPLGKALTSALHRGLSGTLPARTGRETLAFPWYGIIAGLVALMLAPLAWDLPVSEQLLIAAPLIALAGLPHGAMDLPLGRILFRRWFAHGGFIIFLLAYTAVAMATLAIWLLASSVALLLFLGLSLWHFGVEDSEAHGLQDRPGWGVLLGTTPFLALFSMWPDDLQSLFETMAIDGGTIPADFVMALTVILGGLWLVTLAAVVVRERHGLATPDSARAFIDMAVAALLFAALPPLLSFTAYFVLIHGPRHVHSVLQSPRTDGLRPDRSFYALVITASLLPILAGLGAAVLLMPSNTVSPPPPSILVPIVFIGLSTLTVPHILLGHLQKRSNPT